MKCPECDGSGKTPDQDYRKPANDVDTDLAPKKRFVGMKKFFGGLKKHLTKKVIAHTIWVVVSVALVSACGKLMVNGHNDMLDRAELHNKYVAQMGYVVALYDGQAGKSVKCWITKPRTHTYGDDPTLIIDGPTFPFNGPNFAWIEVPDRNDAAGFARNIGVEDVSQCVRMDK